MRVALVSREFPPFFGGGIGTYTVALARALRDAAHQVVVVTVSDDGAEHVYDDDGIHVWRLPFIRGGDWSRPAIDDAESLEAFATHPVLAFSLQVARAMPRIEKRFGIDVVEGPDTGALCHHLLGTRRRPPVVTCVHSPTAWIHHWNRTDPEGEAPLVTLEREVMARSDGVLCPSTDLARWASDFASRPVEVLRSPMGRLQEGAPMPGGDPSTALFVGRLEARKGFDLLCRVRCEHAVRVVAAGADTPFEGGMFGASAMRDATIEIRAVGKSADLDALRREAGCCVLPSLMDNWPYTCMEAMAHAKVVVGFDAGGVGEMLSGDAGVLCPVTDDPVASLSEGLDRAFALDDEERLAMGRRARLRLESLCDNRRVADTRVAWYRAVARGRRSPLRRILRRIH